MTEPTHSLPQRFARLIRHHWHQERGAVHRAIPPAMAERLAAQVRASETRHTGQIRLCVEAGLPSSYIWKGLGARERAHTLFGKLGVWDTEHNNGVLIYLLLSERAIEVLADRGLNAHISPDQWRALVERMGTAFRDGRPEDGLTEAIDEVTELLVRHFPRDSGAQGVNELPDAPVLL